jgi:hypothetical protein
MSDPAFAPAAPAADPFRRGDPPRIRFIAVRVSRAAAGRGRVEVELESLRGDRVCGAADVQAIVEGELRAAAAATLDALHQASDTGHRFALLGVKNVRAFDQHVVLVQIALEAGPGQDADGRPTRLVGSAFADADLMRGAVLAVLNASNRVLWAPSLG